MGRHGRFSVSDDRISGGKSSSVFYGYDYKMGRDVAVKCMGDVSMARREYEVMKDLGNHPNLTQAYGFFKDSGMGYIAMELLNGKPIGDHLLGEKRDQKYSLMVLRGLLDGVSHVHSKGYLHLDVAPQNVLVGESFGLKLVDFGVAHRSTGGCVIGTNFEGTWEYISPEQAESILGGTVSLGYDSDTYAIAGVGLYLLNGVPFVNPEIGLSNFEYLAECIRAKEYASQLSEESPLERVLKKGVSSSKNDRFASCAEFQVALKGLD